MFKLAKGGGRLGGSVVECLPSAQGVIQGSRDRVLHRAPCRDPASPSASVSASLMNKYIKSLKKKNELRQEGRTAETVMVPGAPEAFTHTLKVGPPKARLSETLPSTPKAPQNLPPQSQRNQALPANPKATGEGGKGLRQCPRRRPAGTQHLQKLGGRQGVCWRMTGHAPTVRVMGQDGPSVAPAGRGLTRGISGRRRRSVLPRPSQASRPAQGKHRPL